MNLSFENAYCVAASYLSWEDQDENEHCGVLLILIP